MVAVTNHIDSVKKTIKEIVNDYFKVSYTVTTYQITKPVARQ